MIVLCCVVLYDYVHVCCFGVIINDDNTSGDFWMIFDVPAAEVKRNDCELFCVTRNVRERIKQENTIRYDSKVFSVQSEN